MTLQRPARRRFIQISAACSSAFLLTGAGGLGLLKGTRVATAGAVAQSTHSWAGIALGADASLQITHPDARFAQKLIDRCVAEVQRLENLFSLYRKDSALVRLNRQGYLDAPSSDFLTLLNRSTEFSRVTGGMFDVTVQPLWQAYADYFTGDDRIAAQAHPAATIRGSSTAGMPAALQAAIQDALQRVDWRGISIDTQQVRLLRPGMAITLNGIGQGYITDRITQLLAAHGVDHALVNMGEVYGLNPASPDARQPWQAGLEDARQPGNIVRRVPLYNQAVATSGAYGTLFTPDRRHNHLLDPQQGTSSYRYHSVSVVANDATTADALSTAFTLMPETAIKDVSRQLGVQTYVQAVDDEGIRLI